MRTPKVQSSHELLTWVLNVDLVSRFSEDVIGRLDNPLGSLMTCKKFYMSKYARAQLERVP